MMIRTGYSIQIVIGSRQEVKKVKKILLKINICIFRLFRQKRKGKTIYFTKNVPLAPGRENSYNLNSKFTPALWNGRRNSGNGPALRFFRIFIVKNLTKVLGHCPGNASATPLRAPT